MKDVPGKFIVEALTIGESPNKISYEYDVSGKCIRNIRDRKTWTHI